MGYTDTMKLVNVEFKSLYKEKLTRMVEIGACEEILKLNTNKGEKSFRLGLPLKEKQIKEYVDELNKYQVARFHIHPTFNFSALEIPDEIDFSLYKDEEIIKVIPIVRDRVKIGPNTKYKLGIITTVRKTFEDGS